MLNKNTSSFGEVKALSNHRPNGRGVFFHINAEVQLSFFVI